MTAPRPSPIVAERRGECQPPPGQSCLTADKVVETNKPWRIAMNDEPRAADGYRMTRRTVISAALAAAGGAQAFGQATTDGPAAASASSTAQSTRRYDMRKSINLWAFPYPDKMSLQQCLQLAK